MTEEPGVEALRYDAYTFDQLAAVTGPGAARTTAGLAGRRILSDATMDALRGLPSRHGRREDCGPGRWIPCGVSGAITGRRL